MNTSLTYGRKAIGAIISCALLTGCAGYSSQEPQSAVVTQQVTRTAPGVVEYMWEEPMVDVVEVPPGLDPEGTYYRPAHQEVVEIRQGRWKFYREKQ